MALIQPPLRTTQDGNGQSNNVFAFERISCEPLQTSLWSTDLNGRFSALPLQSAASLSWNNDVTLTRSGASKLTLGPGNSLLPILQFGDTTSAFPALRRNGVILETILADASAYAQHNALNMCAQAAGAFFWLARSVLSSPADAQMNLTNFAATAGVGLDVSSDAVVKVRTRAQSAYATVDALGYSAAGTAGVATFGPSAVASITVKGGIITAIS